MPIKHPIALTTQTYTLPADASIGDQLGEVCYLYTFCRFWNEYEGTNLTEDQFQFIKVAGSNNFTVDINTGMISVNSMVGISSNTSITVRVSIGGMHIDVVCTILFIPVSSCVYFDFSYNGSNGTSNGTRSRPYLKFDGNGLGTGTAGKTYYYKRGTVTENQVCTLINPKVGGQYPQYINVDAWGQGDIPEFTDIGVRVAPSTGTRTFQLGAQPWGDSPPNPSLAGNNIRLLNIKTDKDIPDQWYPILIKPVGDNILLERVDCKNTRYQHGMIYLPTMLNDFIGADDRNVLLQNIKLGNGVERCIKVESGGVVGLNFRCKNDAEFGVAGSPAPTCAHKPNVRFEYLDIEVANISSGSLGLQARASNVVHRWVWAKGLRFVMTPFVHNANDGWGGQYLIDDTVIFDRFIIENSYQAGYCGRHGGTTDVADGFKMTNIKLINCKKGIEISEGAKNTLTAYSDLSGCTEGDGYRTWSGNSAAGIGNKIHNSTIFGSKSQDLDLNVAVSVVNVAYGTILNPSNSTITTSSRSRLEADLLGEGTPLGYEYDLHGNDVVNPPSIGAIEYAEVIPEPIEYIITLSSSIGGTATGGGTIEEGDVATLTATPDEDYEFSGWQESGSIISIDNPYIFTVTGNRNLTPIFSEVIPEPTIYTVTVTAGTGGIVTGGGEYEENQIATLTAIPSDDFHFIEWSNGQTANPYQFVVSGDVSLEAIFEAEEPTPTEVIIVHGRFRIV